jgi:membrane glycosyltransferase
MQGIQYFEPGSYTLFPSWPESRATEIVALLSITLGVLLMPKVLGATLALVNPQLRRGYGGATRLLISVLVEQVFSTLLAPAMMIFHTTFVVTTLAGRPVTWNSQERGDRGIGFLEALNRHKWQILLGLIWAGAILWIAPRYIWWMMPIVAGLVLSAPLTMLTSRASVGRWMRRRGLLLTPEETSPPVELVALEKLITVEAAAIAEATTTKRPAVADDGIGTPHPQDIVGILSITDLPTRVPLQMEAAAPVYLRPRDALTGLHRLLSAAWTTSL